MNESSKAPIALSFRVGDLARVTGYVSALADDRRAATRMESQRLRAYLAALSPLLKARLEREPDAHKDVAPHIDAKALVTPAKLGQVFRTVAARTGNLILSEMMIVSDHVLETTDIVDWYQVFSGNVFHHGSVMTLGFMQAQSPNGTGSVSVPFFSLSGHMASRVYWHQPERMLRAFQVIMTAGNHDMLHQYSNRVLNTKISQENGSEQETGIIAEMARWNRTRFGGNREGENDPLQYESFLMLTHARVRAKMPEAEQQHLSSACDVFFDELSRIAPLIHADLDKKEAGHVLDYFGTALCFALMRFVPLDHPLMTQALVRMEQLAQAHNIQTPPLDHYAIYEADRVLHVYAEQGFTPTGYAKDKLREVIALAPWIGRLMSPTIAAGVSQARARVDEVALEMITLTAELSGMLPDGEYHYWLPENGKRIVRIKGGTLDGGDLPAVEEHGQLGQLRQVWCVRGVVSHVLDRDDKGNTRHGYFRNGRPYQPDDKQMPLHGQGVRT